eukprot:s987_g7.t1
MFEAVIGGELQSRHQAYEVRSGTPGSTIKNGGVIPPLDFNHFQLLYAWVRAVDFLNRVSFDVPESLLELSSAGSAWLCFSPQGINPIPRGLLVSLSQLLQCQ